MSNTLRWGILGTSFISGVMAEAIQAHNECSIYAVAGRNTETLDEFANQYSIKNSFTHYDDLIQDQNVDIIYIALPNHLHHEFIIKAAKAGKAILCEKSLSIDMQKTELALKAITDNNVFFAEGLMYLNHPFISAVQNVIQQGKIGKILSINASYNAAISQFVNPQSKGTLYNLACYPISLMQLILQSEFTTEQLIQYDVSAYGRRGSDGNFCEISGLIRYSNNIVARIQSAEDYGLHHEFTILGSKGSLSLKSNPWLPTTQNQMELTEYEQPSKIIDISAEGDGFYYQVKNIVAALKQGELNLSRPSATPNDSLQIMQVLTDIEYAAAQSE